MPALPRSAAAPQRAAGTTAAAAPAAHAVTDPGWIAHFVAPPPARRPRDPHVWLLRLRQCNEAMRARFALGSANAVAAQRIRATVAAQFGLTRAEITGGGRPARCLEPRQIAIYMCVRFAGVSMTDTGRLFGNRDHTTVRAAVRRIERRRAAEPALARKIDALLAACRKAAQEEPR